MPSAREVTWTVLIVGFRLTGGCVRVVEDEQIEQARSFVMPVLIRKDVVYGTLPSVDERLISRCMGRRFLIRAAINKLPSNKVLE